tara:strand:- start:573 stop:1463 length:891 start_codon:yes stop_codon:yes gene_type:complete
MDSDWLQLVGVEGDTVILNENEQFVASTFSSKGETGLLVVRPCIPPSLAIVGRFFNRLKESQGKIEAMVWKKFENDCFHKYVLAGELLEAEVVYPCSTKILAKYAPKKQVQFSETAAIYEECTVPFLNSIPVSDRKWIDNIFEGKAETESVLERNETFIIMPDYKWDKKDATQLYLLGIVSDPSLRSIRDLREKHLPLLRSLDAAIRNVAAETFGAPSSEIVIFCHYLPSFFQLHVHAVHHRAAILKSTWTFSAIRAHLLSTIIDNISLVPDFYERCTLPMALPIDHPIVMSNTHK